MAQFVALLRGINVGGKNLISMKSLIGCFSAAGFDGVRTFIQSGNVLFASDSASSAELNDDVDSIAPGPDALYFSRTAADSSKSRIDRLRSKRLSQRMTVRNWRTTNRLLEMLDAAD